MSECLKAIVTLTGEEQHSLVRRPNVCDSPSDHGRRSRAKCSCEEAADNDRLNVLRSVKVRGEVGRPCDEGEYIPSDTGR